MARPLTPSQPPTPSAAPALQLGHDANPNAVFLKTDGAQPLGVITKIATTFTVNSSADTTDGICDASSCTLREAIMAANANPGADTIAFNLSNSPPHTIAILSDLPDVTEAATIDGTTEPDFAGTPVVVLDGVGSTGPQGWGLSIKSGNSTVRGLVIHRFATHSAIVLWNGSTNNVVEGNFIGTNATGTAIVGTGSGIDIATSHSNRIGGTTPAARNLVAGATLPAIVIRNGSNDNLVLGNYLGLDVTGTVALRNVGNDILISDSQRTTFGGTAAGARNVVAGNSDAGSPSVGLVNGFDADLATNAIDNLILGNYIGTDISGNIAIGSASVAVYLQDVSNNTVGGVGATRNVIGASGLGGVRVLAPTAGASATGNQILGNSIGVGADGTTALPNASNGVRFSHGAASNTLQDNTIANSLFNGVLVRSDAGIGNRISGNRISNNNLLGIELTAAAAGTGNSDGPTANDPGDGDTGPNGLQNFPVLSAIQAPNQVTGTLDSTPNAAFTIEVFQSPSCDSSGNGEGEQFLGTGQAQTNGSGQANFAIPAPGLVTARFLTATATDVTGSTSEFSACLPVTVTDVCLADGGLCFFTLPPCRVLDTRIAGQGPVLSSDAERVLTLTGGLCGVPASAQAIAMNVTVIQPTGGGFLRFYPEPPSPQQTSTINFAAGQTRANNVVLGLASVGDGTIRVIGSIQSSGTVHLAIDVNGYFE